MSKFSQCSPLLTDVGLLLIRIMVGVVFVFHGGQKLFGLFGGGGLAGFIGYIESLSVPLPTLNAYLAAGSEFFGGMLLIAGLATRIAVIPMAGTMAVAAFVAKWGAFDVRNDGMEYPLTLGVVLIGLMLTGPGRFSLDGLIQWKCRAKTRQGD